MESSLAAKQSCHVTIDTDVRLHFAQFFFSLPWGQALQSAQLRFTLPWEQGLHEAQLSFRLPCEHRLRPILRAPRHPARTWF